MREFKIMDYGSSFNPFNQAGSSGTGTGGGSIGEKFLERIHDHLRVNSIRSRSSQQIQNLQVDNSMLAQGLAIYGLPQKDLIEPLIKPYLKSVDFIESLADVFRRLESCSPFERSRVYVEQCALLRGLHDPKLCKRSLRLARQHAFDVHSKVVLSAAFKYERREEELLGISSMECSGKYLDCPKTALVPGYSPEFVDDDCGCHRTVREEDDVECSVDEEECSISEEECDMSFWIGSEEVRCIRYYMSSLSRPFKAMLYGGFMESKREKINFTQIGISGKAMKAAVIYSRTKSVGSFELEVVLELLSLANKFCCDELKSSCDAFLADKVVDMETAMLLIEYGLEETSYLLVAACLQVILRELPSSLNSPAVLKLFCNPEARERLALAGHASFDLYNLLRQVAMDEDMKANSTVMLLERLGECATEGWQKQLAFHLLGCVMMERKEFKDAQQWFKIAVEAGHTYSSVGLARSKHKRGHTYTAYKLMNSLISNCTPSGWMYQERSLYCNGKEKMLDLSTATELDPTLSYPYKYRAVLQMEENKTAAGITEIENLINFKVSPDCLELRAWFLIAQEDYEGALRDVRALVTLDSNYMMFHGTLHADHLVELLHQHVQQCNQADCWIELYDRWSAVDDIGSLAVVHHMLSNDPGKSLLLFRQSLLLIRLNCNKAAMRSLWIARNRATTEHERLVYEGWILYDTGHWDEALAKAEEAITIKRSFEAFFLKAYALSDPDSSLDSANTTYVVQLLENALRCPSDGLRKGQALSNLGAIYVNSGRLDLAADCYMTALDIKHSRAHVGLARVYHLKNQRKAAYEEMTKLIEKSKYNAYAYEKRSEYCERDMAQSDLSMATKLDPLRTYPYRYRAAIFMDDHKEAEAIAELTKAIAFKTDLQLLHLRATFHDSIGDNTSTIRDCEAALCLQPNHKETLELYHKAQEQAKKNNKHNEARE